MAKAELGTKRLCGACGVKFYDLNKDPIVCPKCSTVFEVVAPVTRARPEPAAARPVPVKEPEVEVAETQGAEFVSLEEADAEAQGKKAPESETPEGAEDVEIEEAAIEDTEDDTFIEETEEGDEDVTDIVGDGIEKEEET
ncbi:MAG: TIGR02300 family protein [Rhizobiales bacterium]|nr:TIGR02300 family protein [Hyphomicrobiales bacterium]